MAVAVLAGCDGEVAGVVVNLAADGSGDCEVSSIRSVKHETGEAANPSALFQNATDLKMTDLAVRQTRAKFASINSLKIGDLSWALQKEDGTNVLTVRIPAASASRWFEALGVSEESLKLCQRLEEESRKEQAARRKNDPKAAGSQVDLPKPSTVAFTVNLPSTFEGQAIETVPVGVDSKIEQDKAERSATVKIPIADIHANKMKEIVWKIRFAAR
jgi:hypothetical protein